MSVEVLIPFAGTCGHRARALDWVRRRYPWPVTIAPGGMPWSKGAALAPAVAASAARVVVIADADVWTDGVIDAVAHVRAHGGWAVPHDLVHRLTQRGTNEVLHGAPWELQERSERIYHGIPGGGATIASRELLLEVPVDPRFIGWGQEDESHGMALETLAGPGWRGEADLVHLWHPSQDRLTRRRGSVAGWQLRLRYRAAHGNPALMRALLAEIECCPSY